MHVNLRSFAVFWGPRLSILACDTVRQRAPSLRLKWNHRKSYLVYRSVDRRK